jgi:Tol biopolymer transport system component
MKVSGRLGLLAVLGASLFLVAFLYAADSGYDLFQKGLAKERTEADFRGAIKLYERVVKEHTSDRKLAAQALFRIGECQQSLGNSDARKVFERVVKEFADQAEIVAQAQARLAGGKIGSGKAFRQLWTGPDVPETGAISPDGKLFVFRRNSDLLVRDFDLNQTRLVTHLPDSSGSAVWSPDGKRLAYNAAKQQLINVINPDGSGMRTIYRNSEDLGAHVESWAPDGKRLLVTVYTKPDGYARFLWLSVADAAIQPIPTRAFSWGGSVFPSPDGKYVVFPGMPAKDSPTDAPYIIGSDGGSESVLLAPNTPRMDAVTWTADGRYVLSTKYEGGRARGLWAIPMSGGIATGPALKIREDFGSDPMRYIGVSRGGAFYYSILTGTSDIYTASMDRVTGKVTSSPNAVPTVRSGAVLPRWSPDGQRLLYYTANPVGATAWSTRELSIFSFAVARNQRVASGVPLATGGTCWSRDGQTLLFNRGADQEKIEPVRFNLSTGQATRLFPAASNFLLRSCSEELVAGFDQSGIKVRNLQDGSEKEVYTFPRTNGPTPARLPVLSHSGRSVALISKLDADSSALLIIPSNGGAARELVRAKLPAELQTLWGAAWAPDDQFIYFARRSDSKSPYELLRISVQGGVEETTGLKVPDLRDLDISPDGTRIAFSIGAVAQPEIWALENFLPSR